MSKLAELLGKYAPGHVLSHNGKDFTFPRIDKAMRVALEVAYYKRAREIVYALKPDLTEEQYDRHLTRVTDAYRRGEYGFPSGESADFYLGRGLPELVAQMTGCGADDAEALCLERSIEVQALCLCVVAESFPEVKKKMLQAAGHPRMMAMVDVLLGPQTSNGSPSPKSTPPPDSSPTAASASSNTPA